MDEKEIWCEQCGVRMERTGERVDLITKESKPIAKCRMCRKWEFVENGRN